MADLEKLYREWCTDDLFNANLEPLEVEQDLHDLDGGEDADECADLFTHIQGMAADAAEEDDQPPADDSLLMDFELRTIPDAKNVKEMLQSRPDPDVKDTPDASIKKSNPKTLFAALCFLECTASPHSVFNQIWRLTMSLRYWRGGPDRHWCRNPRSARRASSSLNWFQPSSSVYVLFSYVLECLLCFFFFVVFIMFVLNFLFLINCDNVS